MQTFKRICLHDVEIVAKSGQRQRLYRGEEYITSTVREDDTVIVFTSPYWAPAPVDWFCGPQKFTKGTARHAED